MTIAAAKPGTQLRAAAGAAYRARASLLSSAAAAVLATVVYLVASPTIIDDAYITLSYARNFGLHLHWGLVPGLVDNTATSPLNVLVLALLTAIVRNGLLALGVSVVLSAVGLEWGLRRVARTAGLPAWTGLLATALCLLNPIVLSSLGMEVLPCAALASWLLVASVERRPWAFGLVAALLAVLRADYVIIAVVVFLMRQDFWVGAWKTISTAIAVAACWYVPSWFLLGSAIPDTLVIKSLQHHWGGDSFGLGPDLYWHVYPTAARLAFGPAVAAVLAWVTWAALRRSFAGLRRLDLLAVLPVAAVIHYGAYAALGVPPYHWYYGPAIVLTTMFLAAGVAAAVTSKPQGWRLALSAGAIAATVLLVGADVGTYSAPGLPRSYPPITTNWASTAQYRDIGQQLPGLVGSQPVQGPVEVGVIDYYCDCNIYDYFSDRGRFPGELARYEQRIGPIGKAILQVNFANLNMSIRPHLTRYVLAVESQPDPHAIRNWRISSPWEPVHYIALLR